GVYADLPLPSPFPDAHITRAGLEAAMAPELDSVTELLLATLADAGVAPERLLDVLLVGGASRIPLMSRLVYQRTGVLPSTLDQAETVVALGALLAGPEPGVAAVSTGSQAPQRVPDAGIAQTLGPATGYRRRATGHAPSRATGSGPNPNAPRWRDTYVATPRSAARRFAPLAAGLVVVALVGVLLVLRPWAGTGRSSGSAEPVGTAQRIAAFDYAFRAPAGWTRTDEDSTALRIRIAPEAAQHGADAVSVQEFRLSASSDGAARDGVLGKLRTLVTGKGYTDFNARAGLAGRSVAYYRGSADGATVDWYVLFNGRVQVSVGCQFTPSGAALVRSVCRQVVGSMRMGHR
ncbi:MAG: type VII secretion-associated protein, partial [Sciscionella sp.]